jgi:hypothetical protein
LNAIQALYQLSYSPEINRDRAWVTAARRRSGGN